MFNPKDYENDFLIEKSGQDYVLRKYIGRIQETLYIPEGVTHIGEGAFHEHEGITKVVLPKTLKKLPGSAFSFWEDLTEVVIPEGVLSIGSKAFMGTAIKEITLPSSLDKLGKEAFVHCNKLEKVTVNHITTNLLNALMNGDHETPETKYNRVEYEPRLAFKIYFGKDDTWEFSQYFRYFRPNRETAKFEIKDSFFIYDNYVVGYLGSETNLEIPNTVKGIAYEAFMGNYRIQSIILGEKSKEVGYSAFENCSSLDAVICNKALESIGDNAFKKTKLKTITIPMKVKYVGDSVFENCDHLESIIVEKKGYSDYRPERWHRHWDGGHYRIVSYNYI